MQAINRQTRRQKWESYKRHPLSLCLFLAVSAAILLTMATLVLVIGYILCKGIPHLAPSLFSITYTSDNQSLMPALVNTLLMTVMALLLAAPLGIFSAIYLIEYAGRGNKLVKVVRITAETLSGIPSIVYGLFGMLFFVNALGWKYSFLSGSFTLAIMILPLIMRTTEEALKSVPDSYREGSFGLGAGRLRTVFRIVLPAAIPGILSGIILAVGRIVGETAALLYTAGSVADYPRVVANPTANVLQKGGSIFLSSGRTLSVHMYVLSGEALYMEEAYATAVVLLMVVVGINMLSRLIAQKIARR